MHKPEKLYIYYHNEPSGQYWEKTLALPGVQRVRLPSDHLYEKFFGHPLAKFAHKADKTRLLTLLRHGGIYQDIDVLTLKSMEQMRRSSFLQGRCAFVGATVGGIEACLIGSQPNCEYL